MRKRGRIFVKKNFYSIIFSFCVYIKSVSIKLIKVFQIYQIYIYTLIIVCFIQENFQSKRGLFPKWIWKYVNKIKLNSKRRGKKGKNSSMSTISLIQKGSRISHLNQAWKTPGYRGSDTHDHV